MLTKSMTILSLVVQMYEKFLPENKLKPGKRELVQLLEYWDVNRPLIQ